MEVTQFQTYWQEFISYLSAQIIRRGGGQLPSHTQMNMILTDAALDWDSEETVSGRWLRGLQNSRKGQLIRSVLVDDMHFRPVSERKGLPPFLQYITAIMGGILAFLLTRLLGGWLWLQILLCILAAVLLYPVMVMITKKSAEAAKRLTFTEYLNQLDVYYQSVLSILSSKD